MGIFKKLEKKQPRLGTSSKQNLSKLLIFLKDPKPIREVHLSDKIMAPTLLARPKLYFVLFY